MVRHHAWAGSVLLGILGAVRWFVADTDYPQKDLIFMTIGILLVIYILIALFFTYRFRSGLAEKQNQVQQQIITTHQSINNESTTDLSPKELAKIEKKKAKNESKRLKKISKAKEKEEKKSS